MLSSSESCLPQNLTVISKKAWKLSMVPIAAKQKTYMAMKRLPQIYGCRTTANSPTQTSAASVISTVSKTYVWICWIIWTTCLRNETTTAMLRSSTLPAQVQRLFLPLESVVLLHVLDVQSLELHDGLDVTLERVQLPKPEAEYCTPHALMSCLCFW